MTDEVDGKRSRRKVVTRLLILGLLILPLYVLTYGPVDVIARRYGGKHAETIRAVLIIPYRPLQWAKQRSPEFAKRLDDDYLLFWGRRFPPP